MTQAARTTTSSTPTRPGLLDADARGRWGVDRGFGGRYIPETLMSALQGLEACDRVVVPPPGCLLFRLRVFRLPRQIVELLTEKSYEHRYSAEGRGAGQGPA